MAKKNIVTIDLDIWATPKQLAKELGYDTKKDCTQRITNWIHRKKVKYKRIEELDLTLVDRNTLPSHT